jgi:hypothetical protein
LVRIDIATAAQSNTLGAGQSGFGRLFVGDEIKIALFLFAAAQRQPALSDH